MTDLPKGVMASRMKAMRDERVETAKVIADLEQAVIDTQNRMVRMSNILSDINSSTPKPEVMALIREAQAEIG